MPRGPKRNSAKDNATGNSGADSGIEIPSGGTANADSGIKNTNSAASDAWGAIPFSEPASAGGGYTEPVSPFADTRIDTGTVSTADTTKRKRGRPPGSTAKTAPVSVSGIEKLLLALHTTLATALHIPEIDMNEAEAKSIAIAYADVAAYYPALSLPPHVAAITTFGSQVAIIYGAKLAEYKMRRAIEKTARPNAPAAQPFTPSPAPQQPSPNAPPAMNGVDPINGGPRRVPVEARRSEIAPGVLVEFPPDHPLVSGRGGNG